jgi:peptidoglycan glycosyltransferase
VGYRSERFGLAGIEASYDEWLSGRGVANPSARARRELFGISETGADVWLTLDAELQRGVAAALGGRVGAAVVVDPRSGEILAMVTSPSFDSRSIEANISSLGTRADRPLLNRTTQGLYPPGSIFKIVTAAAAIDLGAVRPDQRFTCSTTATIGGLRADCANHPHLRELSFAEAFAWSCNRTFALAALGLGAGPLMLGDTAAASPFFSSQSVALSANQLASYSRAFGIGRDLDPGLPTAPAQLTSSGEWTAPLLAQSGFGQGQVLVTPLHAANLAATIANRGVVPPVHLVSRVRPPDDEPIAASRGAPRRAIRESTADALRDMMVLGVDTAYGRPARIPGVKVAGKTGTAEPGPAGAQNHAWFVGFAPADAPRVAVAVVIEHGGSGSEVAAPIARAIIEQALRLP